MWHFLRSQFILQSAFDFSTCRKLAKEPIFKMKFVIVLFCALTPFVAGRSVPIMSRNLVKRQSGGNFPTFYTLFDKDWADGAGQFLKRLY